MGEHIYFRRNERLAAVNPHWRDNPVVRGELVNRQYCFRLGIGGVLKWRLSPNPQRKGRKSVERNPRMSYLHSLERMVGNPLIWLGHNSFFLQLAGKRVMFGPIFEDIPFVERQSDFPANLNIFTDIDYLLIGHDHFDHLDKQSAAWLVKNNPRMKLFCRLGTGELMKSWFPELEVTEAGWYQQIEDDRLKITFLPAQRWSKRSVRDGGQRLWGAFMVQGGGISIYYSGNTGYSRHFYKIPELFEAPDYALVGIGAYRPRWSMQPNHISPYDVLTVPIDIKAASTISMYYGTFDLSDRPLHNPSQVFITEAKKRRIDVYIPVLGETVKLKRM